MVQEIWLVRHGVTPENQDRVIQGQGPVELAPEGVTQVQRLAEHLRRHGPTFGALVTSDLPRARQTADLLGAALDLEPIEEPRFRETDYGDWCGLPYEEVGRRARALGPEPLEVPAPGGESPAAMAARVREAFAERAGGDDPGGPVLLVTHGGAITALVTWVLGLPFSEAAALRFRRSNTGYTVLRRLAAAPAGYTVVTLNATPHLT
jgi:probable phosphoglycerate mutase